MSAASRKSRGRSKSAKSKSSRSDEGFWARLSEWRVVSWGWSGACFVGRSAGWALRSHYAWVFAAIVVLAAGVALHRIRAEAFALDEYLVYPEVFRSSEDTPPWLGADDVAAIRSSIAGVEPFSVFDDGIRARLEDAVRDNAWVRGIASVEREFPNSAVVSLDIRKPIAWVEITSPYQGYHLVDRHGVVLPGRYRNATTAPYPMPVIRGGVGQIVDVPAYGSVWSDGAVREGIAVAIELYLLYEAPFARDVPIAEIDVTNVGGRLSERESEIVLRTKSGVAIEWGRSLLAPRQIAELTTDQKIQNLALLNVRYPRLEGVRRAVIRFDEPGMRDVSTEPVGGAE